MGSEERKDESTGDEALPQKEFFTIKDIASRWGYSKKWVNHLIRSGRIKGTKPIGQWRIPREEYERLLEKGIPSTPKEEGTKPPPQGIYPGKDFEDRLGKGREKKKERRPSLPIDIDLSGIFGKKKEG